MRRFQAGEKPVEKLDGRLQRKNYEPAEDKRNQNSMKVVEHAMKARQPNHTQQHQSQPLPQAESSNAVIYAWSVEEGERL